MTCFHFEIIRRIATVNRISEDWPERLKRYDSVCSGENCAFSSSTFLLFSSITPNTNINQNKQQQRNITEINSMWVDSNWRTAVDDGLFKLYTINTPAPQWRVMISASSRARPLLVLHPATRGLSTARDPNLHRGERGRWVLHETVVRVGARVRIETARSYCTAPSFWRVMRLDRKQKDTTVPKSNNDWPT
jgi:hypothetical protein